MSAIWSQTLSGCPSVTDSDVFIGGFALPPLFLRPHLSPGKPLMSNESGTFFHSRCILNWYETLNVRDHFRRRDPDPRRPLARLPARPPAYGSDAVRADRSRRAEAERQ